MINGITDLELVLNFGELVSKSYISAIKFTELNPDHSLVEFRSLATLLCNDILDKANEEFKEKSLEEKINLLFDGQLITLLSKRCLHQIRKLGNSSAHKHDLISVKDEKSFILLSRENQIQEAIEARSLIIEVLSDLYVFWLKKRSLPKVTLVEDKSESYKELILEGATSSNAKDKYLAGMVYKSLAEDYSRRLPLLLDEDSETKLVMLYECAIAYYKASCKLSGNSGNSFLTEAEHEGDYFKSCDLSSLYQYAFLVSSGWIGKDKVSEGYSLMEMAAERGFGLAQAVLACQLYDKGEDYLLAKDYAEKAISQNIAEGHRLLFHYHSTGKATKPNIGLALKHIHEAINTGCSEAFYDLGCAYFESKNIVKDIEKSKLYLLKAIENGHNKAFLFYEFSFNNLTEKMADGFKRFGDEMLSVLESHSPPKQTPVRSEKKKPNGKCGCGSNIKYKKCHGSPAMKGIVLEEIRKGNY